MIFLKIYLAGSGLSCVTWGLFAAARGLLPSCGVPAPERAGPVVAVRGLGCPAPCGILVP